MDLSSPRSILSVKSSSLSRSQSGSVQGEDVLAVLGRPGFKSQLCYLTERHRARGFNSLSLPLFFCKVKIIQITF